MEEIELVFGERLAFQRARAKEILESLLLRAALTGGPDQDNIFQAFFAAERYPEFDNDPAASWLTGYLAGMADALGVSIKALIEELV